MPRPVSVARQALRATRPSASRMPGAGESVALGPSAAEIGQPVIQLSEGDKGEAIVTVRYESPLIGSVRDGDLSQFKAIAETMKHVAVSMSKGPYSLKALALMGHPYAKNRSGVAAVAKKAKAGHAVPRFAPGKAIGHVKGISGSVPTLAIVNLQSGHLAASWEVVVKMDAGGVTVTLRNNASYAAYLLFGTDVMIAHGPFEYVQRLFLPRFNGEWARVITVAWKRQPKRRAAKALEAI